MSECCHNKLVAQINSLLHNFACADANVKIKLLKSYCLSLYGCKLWDLSHIGLQTLIGFVNHSRWWCEMCVGFII